ncbi:MAG: DUF433 domain-containing protein [Bacteroidota bacterium]
MNWQEHIVSDKEVLAGKPTLKGTRLSVELIMERLADGWSEKDLFDSYPRLSAEALRAVYAYAFALMSEGWKISNIPQSA